MTVTITGPSSEQVTLDDIGYERKDRLLVSEHLARNGKQYRYGWGSFGRIKFDVSMVDSATACMVNSWWAAGSALVAQHQNGEVTSGYLQGSKSPFDKRVKGRADLWRGTIELETY